MPPKGVASALLNARFPRGKSAQMCGFWQDSPISFPRGLAVMSRGPPPAAWRPPAGAGAPVSPSRLSGGSRADPERGGSGDFCQPLAELCAGPRVLFGELAPGHRHARALPNSAPVPWQARRRRGLARRLRGHLQEAPGKLVAARRVPPPIGLLVRRVPPPIDWASRSAAAARRASSSHTRWPDNNSPQLTPRCRRAASALRAAANASPSCALPIMLRNFARRSS
jgi:hypothetical protein